MNETNENSVRPEKVWYIPYSDNPKEVTVLQRKYNHVVVDDESSLITANVADIFPTQEAALLAIYEKKFNQLNYAMENCNTAKKNLDLHRKGKKI